MLEVMFCQPKEMTDDGAEVTYSGTELRRLRPAGRTQIELPARRHSSRVLGEVADAALTLLKGDLHLGSEAGRAPDTENWARWWAAAVFDGLTPVQIAARDAGADLADQQASDALQTPAETIETTFRKIGVDAPEEPASDRGG